MRAFAASASAGFVGPRFEPAEAPRVVGAGAVAESRPQKYFGSSNGWPMSASRRPFRSRTIRLPFAWSGNAACATPVTRSG